MCNSFRPRKISLQNCILSSTAKLFSFFLEHKNINNFWQTFCLKIYFRICTTSKWELISFILKLDIGRFSWGSLNRPPPPSPLFHFYFFERKNGKIRFSRLFQKGWCSSRDTVIPFIFSLKSLVYIWRLITSSFSIEMTRGFYSLWHS